MKKPYRYVVPVALGVALSACSTQTTYQDSAVQQTKLHSVPAASENTSEHVSSSDNRSEMEALRQQLTENADQMARLTAKLDDKDRQLSQLMQGDKEASLLLQMRQIEAERDALEIQYNQLRLENDRLTAKIERLENDVQIAQQTISERKVDFMELNKSFRTLDSAHFALSKDYRDLSVEHAHLKSQYKMLQDKNLQLAETLDTLGQENLTLGGALSEARAQHQVLWDKIRVQSNVIDTLQNQNAELHRKGRLVIAADDSAPEAADNSAQLEAKVARLQAELSAQNNLISGYQSDVVKLEAALQRQEDDLGNQLQSLESTYQTAAQRNRELERELAQLKQRLASQETKAESLAQELQSSAAEKQQMMAQLVELRARNDSSAQAIKTLQAQSVVQAEEKALLENQVNNLIPFEGAVLSLQNQLKSELTNVRWSLPTSANLHDTFEIQLSADVASPVQGQTYYAELFVDSALNMMSAAEAESTLNQGQLNFRWRLSGLNERPNATMNVSVTQEVNYDGEIILRKIYRDTESVELISTDWLNKYGFWGAAILGGLLLGFAVGKLGQSNRSERRV
ncbi:coiled-coil domain-containing protein [Marinomonas gallaica]|uniref:hypothetical protein n=1 Tax=Marinomonas gallaica TaxID=1806667 RepID=UPI00082A9328|nr:hypothetical protein [Marinomonas gallaica]